MSRARKITTNLKREKRGKGQRERLLFMDSVWIRVKAETQKIENKQNVHNVN